MQDLTSTSVLMDKVRRRIGDLEQAIQRLDFAKKNLNQNSSEVSSLIETSSLINEGGCLTNIVCILCHTVLGSLSQINYQIHYTSGLAWSRGWVNLNLLDKRVDPDC